MRKAILLIALIWVLSNYCAGCASMDRTEFAWQALHAIDVAQTLNAAKDPCYAEHEFGTAQLIGEQPSATEVLAWGAGIAALHAYAMPKIDERWPRVAKVLRVIDFGYKGSIVAGNHSRGVRAFGDNEMHDQCVR